MGDDPVVVEVKEEKVGGGAAGAEGEEKKKESDDGPTVEEVKEDKAGAAAETEKSGEEAEKSGEEAEAEEEVAEAPQHVAAGAVAGLIAAAVVLLEQTWADGLWAFWCIVREFPQGATVCTHSLKTVSLNDRQAQVERYQHSGDFETLRSEEVRVVVNIKEIGVKALLSKNLRFVAPPPDMEAERKKREAVERAEAEAKDKERQEKEAAEATKTRRAPDGIWRTKKQFQEKYGGDREWDTAPCKVTCDEKEVKVTKGEGGKVGLTIDTNMPALPTISGVAQGGPAEAAGLQAGMRILKVEGKKILAPSDIGPAVREAGDTFSMIVGVEKFEFDLDEEMMKKPRYKAALAGACGALAIQAVLNVDDGSEEIERLISEGVEEVRTALEYELPFAHDDLGRTIIDQAEGGSECLAHILEHAQSTFICPFCESRMGVRRVDAGWFRCNQCKDDCEIDMCGMCLRKKKDLKGPQGPYHPVSHTWSYLDRIARENKDKVVEGFKVAYREKLNSYPVRRVGRTGSFEKPTRKCTQNLKHKRFVMEWLEEELECDWCGVRVGMKYPHHGWFKCNTCEPCEKDMCGWCFDQQWDLTKKLGDDEGHTEEHTFTNIIRMMEKKEDSASQEEREKPIPISPAEITSSFSPDHFCMKCMAPFDIVNPHNPRRHPNPEFPLRGPHGQYDCDFCVELRTADGRAVDAATLKRLSCQLCGKTVRCDTPVRTTLTLHTFCADCLMKHLATSSTDPVDGRPLKVGDFARFHTLSEELLSLWAPCLYREDGCPCVIPLREYRDHCDTCEHRRTPCQFRIVGCPYVLPNQYTVQHTQDCSYGKIAHYIRRNEMQKRQMKDEISQLKEALGRVSEQLSLLVQEKGHVYSNTVFEVDEDDVVGTSGGIDTEVDMEALHARKRSELDRERQPDPPAYTWDEHYKGTRVNLSEDMLVARGARTVQTLLAQQPMKKPGRGQKGSGEFYWEVRVDEAPSCGPVRVGLARNPLRSSHSKSLDLDKPLGTDELSWGWYSSGTFVHDTEHRLDDKGEPAGKKAPLYHNVKQMRFGKGDYLGFLLDCKSGELFLFKNRVFVGKHQGLAKQIVDPHSKRKSDPIYFAAASPGYIHHSVTLRPNAPMPARPSTETMSGMKRFDRKN
eukprot:Hpha_TRINITY_DN8515_c0_g1::TRINITY_DN8515_c0_g1_i1::g.146315::m.146315